MPETLSSPQEEPIRVVLSYFESIPEISPDDHSFADRIADTALSISQIDSLQVIDFVVDTELLQNYLLVPQLIAYAAADGANSSFLMRHVHEFGKMSGKIAGRITADAANLYTPRKKVQLLCKAYAAIYYLGETFGEGRATLYCSPQDTFQYSVCNSLDTMVQYSVNAAFNCTDDSRYSAMQQAIFLADAGTVGFLSKERLLLLRAAWATTPEGTLVNVTAPK